jgi:phage gpG-like protein
MEEFYKDALDLIEERSDALFAQRGQNAEKAEKWRPLSPRTNKARERRWGYYKKTPNRPSVLRWTWRLQTDRTKTIEKNRAIFEFNAPYAIYHQTWGWRLPKRAIIDLDNNTNREIVRAMQAKVQRDIGIFGTQI